MILQVRKLQTQTYGQIGITCDEQASFYYAISFCTGGLGYTADSRIIPVVKGYTYRFALAANSTGVQIRSISVWYP